QPLAFPGKSLGLGNARQSHHELLPEGAEEEMVLVVLPDLALVGHAVGVDLVLARLARRNRGHSNVVGRHGALLVAFSVRPNLGRAAPPRKHAGPRPGGNAKRERTLPAVHLARWTRSFASLGTATGAAGDACGGSPAPNGSRRSCRVTQVGGL